MVCRPPSVDEWLPEKHLARFVVEVVDASADAGRHSKVRHHRSGPRSALSLSALPQASLETPRMKLPK